MEIELYPYGAVAKHSEIFDDIREGSVKLRLLASYVNLFHRGNA